MTGGPSSSRKPYMLFLVHGAFSYMMKKEKIKTYKGHLRTILDQLEESWSNFMHLDQHVTNLDT